MKVLFVSTFEEGAYGSLIRIALIKLRHEVYPFDYRMALSCFGEEEMNRQLEKHIYALDPDLFFVIKGESLRKETIESVKCRKVLWFPDDGKRYARFSEIESVFDEVYMTEYGRGYPVMYPAAEPMMHKEYALSPGEQVKYNCDVAFIGTGHPKRIKQMKELTRNLDIDLKIWGNEWPEDFRYNAGGPQYFTNLCKAISGSKLVINFHYDWPFTPNNRAFEVTACKRCYISETGEGLEKCFEPNKEFVPFTSIEEAREKIKYYLKHPEDREAIAIKGYERCIHDHTLEKRLKEVLKV